MKNRKIKVYHYSGCSTCRKALKFLDESQLEYEAIAIRDTPPTLEDLKKAKQSLGDLKKLFNVSGVDYRAENWKEKLFKISESEALKELSKNGNLIKRPFLIYDQKYLVGFKEDEWKKLFLDGD